MSPEIQNEFIAILGDKVRQNIINYIRKHSGCFPQRPNKPGIKIRSKNEEVQVVEFFIDFIETKYKTAQTCF